VFLKFQTDVDVLRAFLKFKNGVDVLRAFLKFENVVDVLRAFLKFENGVDVLRAFRKWRRCPESVPKPKPASTKIYVFFSRIYRGVDVL
jgi:hypothetical protein